MFRWLQFPDDPFKALSVFAGWVHFLTLIQDAQSGKWDSPCESIVTGTWNLVSSSINWRHWDEGAFKYLLAFTEWLPCTKHHYKFFFSFFHFKKLYWSIYSIFFNSVKNVLGYLIPKTTLRIGTIIIPLLQMKQPMLRGTRWLGGDSRAGLWAHIKLCAALPKTWEGGMG